MKASLDTLTSNQAPISYVSPNTLELNALYQAARDNDLTSHDAWWRIIDDMGVGSEFRLDLEHLSRRNACDTNVDKGTLGFLVNDGTAQMAIHLLPFFQHIVLKCGQLGVIVAFRSRKESGWSRERTNIKARQVVVQGKSGNSLVLKHYPAETLDSKSLVNVTGAGDSLVGSLLASLLQNPTGFQNPQLLDQIISQAQGVCHYIRLSIYLQNLKITLGRYRDVAKFIGSVTKDTSHLSVAYSNSSRDMTVIIHIFHSEAGRGPTATCSRARRNLSFSAAIITRRFSFALFS